MAESLGEALPEEMARVRDEVMPAYQVIGRPGAIALTMMRMELDRAARAMAEGDLPQMIASLKSLREFEV